MSFELIIKQAVSPSSNNDDNTSIKEIAKQLLDLLIKKTPEDAKEDDLISALQRYLNE